MAGSERSRRTGRRGRGFTVIELLVVIGIIAILVSLALAVAAGVAGTGKQRVTQDTIRVLDNALADYMSERGSLPPAFIRDPRKSGGKLENPDNYFPVADARNMTLSDDSVVLARESNQYPGNQMLNSVALFMESIRDYGSAYQVIAELDPSLFKDFSTNSPDLATGNDPAAMPLLPTVLDGWGNPIRFVHPEFSGQISGPSFNSPGSPADAIDMDEFGLTLPPGGQWGVDMIRRNAQTEESEPANAEELPDADGGRLAGQTPYFYSAGADGLVGALRAGDELDAQIILNYNQDNVYTTRPLLPTDDDGAN